MGPESSKTGVLMRNVETDLHTENSFPDGEKGWSDGSYKPRNAKFGLQPLKANRGNKGCSLIGFRGILTLLTP